jgi:ABC-type transport system involved in multi-copper enzyme maturation permease subunit
MATNEVKRTLSLARQEWRRLRFSPVWLLGTGCAVLLALSESGSSNVLGYPTLNQALYGFQLAASVVFGFVAFLLASGSLAADLEGPRKALIFSRPITRAEFLLAKFLGVCSLGVAAVLPVLVLSACTPLLHGTLKAHDPRPFLAVLVLCVIPMVAYVTALGLALVAIVRKVIVALPVFVLYFFSAALVVPSTAAHVSFLDFSGRLYPRELVVQTPLRLSEYTFSGLLSPASPELLARSVCYLLLSLTLLGGAWLALWLDLDVRFQSLVARWAERLRLFRRERLKHSSAKVGLRAGGCRISEAMMPALETSPSVTRWARNELTLLWYSARMLAGRNLLSAAMILVGLFFIIATYEVGARQTRAGVLLFQLEMFAPLLGIVMFSDLVAADFEARRADMLRVSRRGASWVLWRKLVHASLFSTLGCLVLILALRVVYAGFNVLHALAVALPGVLFFGMIGLVAASTARRSLVGYAAGTAAMAISLVLTQVEPLTSTSFHAREHLANGRLLGPWNWLLAKVVFCLFATTLAMMVLRLSARPELVRRVLAATAGLLLVTYCCLHFAWSGLGKPPQATSSLHELELREVDNARISRRVLITSARLRGRESFSAELVDVRLRQKEDRWETESQTPVDLTRELEIPHLDLETSVKPSEGAISGLARFAVHFITSPAESVRFFLGAELEIERLTLNGQSAKFTRYADLVEVMLPRKAEPGEQLNLEMRYGGKLRLPQHLGFEGVSRDLLFVTTRWYPCLRGTRAGPRPLFTCSAKIHAPPGYHVAAARLLHRSQTEGVFLWESGCRVEWVPLCVGKFKVYEMEFGKNLGLSFCTFSAGGEYTERMLKRAARLLKLYETEFGPYPYRHAAIVENRFQAAGGAGFSSMITIKPERLAPEHEEMFATAYLPHELAHLWFGNTVTPWIAESCAVYSSYHSLTAEQGRPAAIGFLDKAFYPAIAAPETTAAPLVKAEGELTYTKGGYLLKMLGDCRGDAVILKAMKGLHQDVLERRRMDMDELSDYFISSLKTAAGPELESFVQDITRTVKRFDPAITVISTNNPGSPGEASLELRHFGEMRFPVPVKVNFRGGASQSLVWTGLEARAVLVVRGTAAIVSAQIDSEHDLLDWNRANNYATPGSALPKATERGANLAGWKTYSAADGLADLDIRSITAAGDRLFASAWSFRAAVDRRWAIGSVRDEKWEPYNPKAEPSYLVTTIAVSPNGALWLGNQNQLRRIHGDEREDWFLTELRRGGPIGAGAFVPNPYAASGLPGSQIYSLLSDRSGRLWAGTDHGLAVFTPAGAGCRVELWPSMKHREVFALATDDSGPVWAGTDKGLFKLMANAAARSLHGPDDLVLSVALGVASDLWCGTFRNGLWHVTPTSASRYSCANAPLPDTIFSGVACDKRGRVWAATPDGLIRFDGKDWMIYDRNNSGLPSNRIHCVTVDAGGRVWLGTDAGLTSLTPDS